MFLITRTVLAWLQCFASHLFMYPLIDLLMHRLTRCLAYTHARSVTVQISRPGVHISLIWYEKS